MYINKHMAACITESSAQVSSSRKCNEKCSILEQPPGCVDQCNSSVLKLFSIRKSGMALLLPQTSEKSN